MAEANVMEKIVSLCKRRGFVYPASEIYGGLNGFWDYGPLGVLLKNNIRDSWWRDMVECPPIGPEAGWTSAGYGGAGFFDYSESEDMGGERARGGV